jgi:hypothetical protein
VSALTAKRTYAVLAAVQAGDAVLCAIPIPPITKVFDDLGVPMNLRRIIPPVKAASAIGLFSVNRFPRLARLTTAMLTVYFVVAVSFHVKAKDWSPALVAALSFLGLYGAMTVKGPSVRA